MTKYILVADHDPDILELISEILEDAGFHVEAATGRAALSKLETLRPDLVLLDYQMPEVDGVQIARRIRAHPELANVRIVAMTAAGHVGQVCREMHANGCLGKPFDIEDLLTVVEQPDHRAHPAA